MMNINQKKLLRTLYEQGIINLYAWHQETCLSPISIANAVLILQKSGLLQLIDNHQNVSLTEYGRRWIELHSKELFATKSDEPWKKVPEEMSSEDNMFFQGFFEKSDVQKLLDTIKKETRGR